MGGLNRAIGQGTLADATPELEEISDKPSEMTSRSCQVLFFFRGKTKIYEAGATGIYLPEVNSASKKMLIPGMNLVKSLLCPNVVSVRFCVSTLWEVCMYASSKTHGGCHERCPYKWKKGLLDLQLYANLATSKREKEQRLKSRLITDH